MKILLALATAATRGESIRSVLTTRKIEADKAIAKNLLPRPPITAADAEARAKSELLSLADEQLSTPSTTLRDYLAQSKVEGLTETVADDLVSLAAGARQLRDWLDELEITAGRAARAHGASARSLAQATGIAERNAAKRYRPIPGEGWTSLLPR